MSDNAQEWRWVGEDGVEKTVTEQELIAELSSESLPNYTLVWRKGWLEWLPAMQISELSWALPAGKSDEAVKPREKPTAALPPAPPLYRYPVLKRRAANLRSDAPLARSPVAAPRPLAATKSPGGPPPPVAPTSLDPPTLVVEDHDNKTEPQQPRPSSPASIDGPTLVRTRPLEEEVDMDSIEASNPAAAEDLTSELDEDENDVVSAESNPNGGGFGALAPERGALGRAYGEEDDADTRVIPSRPPPPLGPLYVGPHSPPTSERPPPSYEPAEIQAPPLAYDEEDEDIPRLPPPPAAPMDLAAYAGTAPRARVSPPPVTQKSLYLTVAGTIALAGVIGALLFHGGSESDTTAANPSSSAAGASDTPAPPPPGEGSAHAAASVPAVSAPVVKAPEPQHGPRCTVVTSATRIADWAEPAITPSFSAIPGSERIAVGFGQSETYAIGITIDSRTLDRDQVFREFRKQKLVSVVPTTDQDKLHFQVVRAGGVLDNARAVDAKPPFLLGTTSAGVERAVGKSEPERVWSFATADGVTIPRVATLPGIGHAVTIRRGGQAGRIAAGWLEPSGRKRTELVDVRLDGVTAVGTPTISASDDRILIAFASRTGEGKDWSVELATAKAGELPRVAKRFEPPPGGPGGSAISPAAASLPGNRWLLQWTEGDAGNRVVRAQVLASDLTPASQPVNLSPDGANAGQGVVLAHRDAGAILFYVQNEKKSHELWGATIDCPE